MIREREIVKETEKRREGWMGHGHGHGGEWRRLEDVEVVMGSGAVVTTVGGRREDVVEGGI